ncbi:uncharacterized protein LOC123546196 [Mercenaria mercenaria]|uniref:uncharacterized protein LOC123546196 n=1 Tax=Mercenaria mercenaria TaxID=6596 RepID=UPI00234F17E6|nr:uncharacterized protein LOC123546196 [Mercenaria mercenaria]
MNVLILIILLLRIMSAMGDQQCDCSALTFLKQLVQQEMFERKLEISMLRSEMRKVSTVPKLLETTNSMEDVHTRVEKLEQRFSMLENASDIGPQEKDAPLEA